jgi:hypothetical protein
VTTPALNPVPPDREKTLDRTVSLRVAIIGLVGALLAGALGAGAVILGAIVTSERAQEQYQLEERKDTYIQLIADAQAFGYALGQAETEDGRFVESDRILVFDAWAALQKSETTVRVVGSDEVIAVAEKVTTTADLTAGRTVEGDANQDEYQAAIDSLQAAVRQDLRFG